MAGGKCPQDIKYWCPLEGASCKIIPASCVLLVASKAGDKYLAEMKLEYEVRDGSMILKGMK